VQDLQCPSCSAPLALPADLAAVDVTCAYCKHVTVLPSELVRTRLERQAEQKREAAQVAKQAQVNTALRRTFTFVAVIGIVSVALPLLIWVGIMVAVFSFASNAQPPHPPVSAPAPARHR
jgi:hypothetical protein